MTSSPTKSSLTRVKLAHLTNKCTNTDLDFWITEAGNIMGLKDKVNTNNPKEVLLYVMNSIIKFKMSMQ
jgi:intraflagellar transport protein 52